MKLAATLFLLISILGWKNTSAKRSSIIDTLKDSRPSAQLTLLSLGDSYTIGHAVPEDQNYPHQLSALLNSKGLNVAPPMIIATSGWTTSDLISGIQAATVTKKYDIVTLLIGVNNEYREYPIDTYRREFRKLLKTAVTFAGGNAAHVFVLSIPDWGATPFGERDGRNVESVAKDIDAYNAINKEETAQVGANYTDVNPESKKATSDLSLVAQDGLHPSGMMYKEWVALLAPAILKTYK